MYIVVYFGYYLLYTRIHIIMHNIYFILYITFLYDILYYGTIAVMRMLKSRLYGGIVGLRVQGLVLGSNMLCGGIRFDLRCAK
jgi:hypothetical protein